MILTEQDIKDVKRKLYKEAYFLAEKFQPTFQANEWKWSQSGEPSVPTTDDIESIIYELTRMLYPGSSRSFVSTGRIEITVRKESDTYIDVRVNLVAETKLFGIAYYAEKVA